MFERFMYFHVCTFSLIRSIVEISILGSQLLPPFNSFCCYSRHLTIACCWLFKHAHIYKPAGNRNTYSRKFCFSSSFGHWFTYSCPGSPQWHGEDRCCSPKLLQPVSYTYQTSLLCTLHLSACCSAWHEGQVCYEGWCQPDFRWRSYSLVLSAWNLKQFILSSLGCQRFLQRLLICL